ncbi:MAG: hypothetical protein ACXWM8_00415 [Candidatus Limnocylindrales bacterium]
MQTMSRTSTLTAAEGIRMLVWGFFGVQFFLGYEWLMSGLAKVVAGDFASSLAGTLSDMTKDQTGWYKSFIDGVVIPNGPTFGYLVMLGELSVGTVLIVTSLICFARWADLSSRNRGFLLALVAFAGLVGASMSLNFHLAMGANPPWMIAADPNDQGVDLDSLLAMLQLVLATVCLGYLVLARRRADRLDEEVESRRA